MGRVLGQRRTDPHLSASKHLTLQLRAPTPNPWDEKGPKLRHSSHSNDLSGPLKAPQGAHLLHQFTQDLAALNQFFEFGVVPSASS